MASTWAAHLWKEEPCRAIWAGTSALFLYSPLAEHQSSSYLPPAAGGGGQVELQSTAVGSVLCMGLQKPVLFHQERSSSLLTDAGAASEMQHFHCVLFQLKLTVPAGEIQVA